jgi:hypothetical protein
MRATMIKFVVEDRPHPRTGTPLPTVVKKEDGAPDDEWCTIQDLDELFEACVTRWGTNWDLNKVKMAVAEAEFN